MTIIQRNEKLEDDDDHDQNNNDDIYHDEVKCFGQVMIMMTMMMMQCPRPLQIGDQSRPLGLCLPFSHLTSNHCTSRGDDDDDDDYFMLIMVMMMIMTIIMMLMTIVITTRTLGVPAISLVCGWLWVSDQYKIFHFRFFFAICFAKRGGWVVGGILNC